MWFWIGLQNIMLGKIKACTYGVAFVACQFLASYEKKSKIQLHYNADGSGRAARAIALPL